MKPLLPSYQVVTFCSRAASSRVTVEVEESVGSSALDETPPSVKLKGSEADEGIASETAITKARHIFTAAEETGG